MKIANHQATATAKLLPVWLVVLACLLAAPSQSRADPCSRSDDPAGCATDPSAFRVKFKVNSATPRAITNIFDFYTSRSVAQQGRFSIDTPPSLPTGSGTLDAGYWVGEDAHFLAGITVDANGNDHLVMMVNPATAALMTTPSARPFDDMVNGIPPLGQPNPFPVTNAELDVIDRIKNTPPEFDNDVWSFFSGVFHPNRLDPSVLLSNSSGSAMLTMLEFSTATVIGSVDVQVTPVPEPATWMALLAGLGLIALWRRANPPVRA